MAKRSSSGSILAAVTATAGLYLAAPSSIAPAVEPDATCASPKEAFTHARLQRTAEAVRHSARLQIVAIGSSSTLGVGASEPRFAYPAQLDGLLKLSFTEMDIEVVNLGRAGELARQAAERIERNVLARPPTLLVWQVGTADGVGDVTAGDYARVLRETARKVRASHVDLILVGMQWSAQLQHSAHYLEIEAATERVARDEQIPMVSRFDIMRADVTARGREAMLSADGFHLNDFGYRCLAQGVARLVESTAADSRFDRAVDAVTARGR